MLAPFLHLYGYVSYTGGMAVAERAGRTATRIERLEARVSREAKALCQRAARLQGLTLTDFVVNSAVEAAKRTVRESEFLELSYRERVAFVEALLKAPTIPNAKLRKAAKRYARVLEG
jgi:uncharacterized protein (DUF1778 family)